MKDILLSFFCTFLVASQSSAQTLDDLYEMAKQKTLTVQEKVLDEKIAKREKQQAYSEVLPTLTVNSTNTWREEVNAGAFGESPQHTAYVSLEQPIFQGGAEYYALAITNRLPDIARYERIQAEISLYTSVAEAFYRLFRIGREVRTLEEQHNTLITRVKTLRKRARIGRNKKTDVLAAETQAARVLAEKAQVEAEMLRAKVLLLNLTSLEAEPDLIDETKVETLSVPESWEKNLNQNPALKSLELQVQSADADVGVATGSFLPSVDVEANYYIDRAGVLADSEWDVSLNASWEIFSSGADYTERKIKKLELEKLIIEKREKERILKNDFKTLKSDFLIQQKTVEKLKLAVDLSKKNYRQHIKESNQGLVSQLDVLRALEEYLQVRRAYEQQIYDAKIAWVKLRALAGVRP